MDASAQARFDLIRENLEEIMNPEILETILAEGRNPRIYWGKYELSSLWLSAINQILSALFHQELRLLADLTPDISPRLSKSHNF